MEIMYEVITNFPLLSFSLATEARWTLEFHFTLLKRQIHSC